MGQGNYVKMWTLPLIDAINKNKLHGVNWSLNAVFNDNLTVWTAVSYSLFEALSDQEVFRPIFLLDSPNK